MLEYKSEIAYSQARLSFCCRDQHLPRIVSKFIAIYLLKRNPPKFQMETTIIQNTYNTLYYKPIVLLRTGLHIIDVNKKKFQIYNYCYFF